MGGAPTGRRRRRPPTPARRDDGAALVLALVIVIIASLMVLPLLDYAMSVTRSSRLVGDKADRVEAAKGGLRVALSDPVSLYKVCDAAGLTVAVTLASPQLAIGVNTSCFKLDETSAEDPDNLRYGVATLEAGSAIPDGASGKAFPGSGAADETAWVASSSSTMAADTIWLPQLPAHGLNRRAPGGYPMPASFGSCTVYFPGTYPDPITISSSTPVYFASGIYYFEQAVRLTGDAHVVIGGGAVEGCATDQEAAFYAVGAPATHNVGGLGATFVFGAQGRLVVDDATAGSALSVQFNQRYVEESDESTASSAGVSIMTVNGAVSGGTAIDLTVDGSLFVPLSVVSGDPPTAALAEEYLPSTLVAAAAVAPPPEGTTTTAAVTTTTVAPPPAVASVIEVTVTGSRPTTVSIPGYVAVPQGRISIAISAEAAASASVAIFGGVVAGAVSIADPRPATLSFGLVNPIVQKTFKIVSTASGSPKVVSTAIVQVNQNGAYEVNDWSVQ